jgi:hypothetical protein
MTHGGLCAMFVIAIDRESIPAGGDTSNPHRGEISL